MDRAQCGFDAEHDDQPLDLPPATIAQMIAHVAACLCSIRSLKSGRFTKLVDERFCFKNIARFDIKRQKHNQCLLS